MGILLRTLLTFIGLGIAFFGVWSLHDGYAVLGIPGRNTQSAPYIVHLDAWPELLVTAVMLGAISALFMLAGISPRLFSRPPVVPVLIVFAFVLLVAIPFLTSAK